MESITCPCAKCKERGICKTACQFTNRYKECSNACECKFVQEDATNARHR